MMCLPGGTLCMCLQSNDVPVRGDTLQDIGILVNKGLVQKLEKATSKATQMRMQLQSVTAGGGSGVTAGGGSGGFSAAAKWTKIRVMMPFFSMGHWKQFADGKIERVPRSAAADAAVQAVAEETNPYDTDDSDDQFDLPIAEPYGHAHAIARAPSQRRKRGYRRLWTLSAIAAPFSFGVFFWHAWPIWQLHHRFPVSGGAAMCAPPWPCVCVCPYLVLRKILPALVPLRCFPPHPPSRALHARYTDRSQ